MTWWRDMDNHRRKWGVVLWHRGGELRLGYQLYRWRW